MKVISTLLFGFIIACSGVTSNEKAYTESDLEGLSSAEYATDELEEGMFEFSGNSTEQETAAPSDSKIIKTANIEFETRDMRKTHKRVLDLVQQNKAFLQKDNTGKQYSREFRQLVIRVPTQSFQALVDSIGVGVAYFDRKDISRKDVGEEFVDLQARLKAKRVLEERYLELLSKANNVKDMLEIERELSSIREEIEAKQGRLNYLQNQVSLSTIYLEFYRTDVETIASQSYGAKMVNALKGGWNGISSFFLGILYIWPFLLIITIIAFIIRRYLKRNKKVAS